MANSSQYIKHLVFLFLIAISISACSVRSALEQKPEAIKLAALPQPVDLVISAVALDKQRRYSEADTLYAKAEKQVANDYQLKHGSPKGAGKFISICRAKMLIGDCPDEKTLKAFPWLKEYIRDKNRGILSYAHEYAIVPIGLRSVRDFRSAPTGSAQTVRNTQSSQSAVKKLEKLGSKKTVTAGDATYEEGIAEGIVITQDEARSYLARLDRKQALSTFKWSRDFLPADLNNSHIQSPPMRMPPHAGRTTESLQNFLSEDFLLIDASDYAKLMKIAKL